MDPSHLVECSLLPFVMYLWCCLHLVLYVIKICFYILFIQNKNKNKVWSVLRNTCIMLAARCICITVKNKLLMFMASGTVYLSEIKERYWANTVPHFLSSIFLVYYVDIKKKKEYIRRATCPLSHNWATVFCGNCDSVRVNTNINIKYLQTNMIINVIGVTSTT